MVRKSSRTGKHIFVYSEFPDHAGKIRVTVIVASTGEIIGEVSLKSEVVAEIFDECANA